MKQILLFPEALINYLILLRNYKQMVKAKALLRARIRFPRWNRSKGLYDQAVDIVLPIPDKHIDFKLEFDVERFRSLFDDRS